MSSPYPGFAQCRKAMKPDGSSPFPNKPSYQQCPDTWACHEADVGQTCFTPFSEKAGLVPKGGPPEDLCDNTCNMYDIQKLQHQVLRPRLAECGQRLLPSRHGL